MNRQRGFSAVIAQTLIVALLAGGLPMFSGVIVTRTDRGPALTLNICHPLPGLNLGSGVSPVPLVDRQPSVERPSLRGIVEEVFIPSLLRIGDAPDPPPPKPMG